MGMLAAVAASDTETYLGLSIWRICFARIYMMRPYDAFSFS